MVDLVEILNKEETTIIKAKESIRDYVDEYLRSNLAISSYELLCIVRDILFITLKIRNSPQQIHIMSNPEAFVGRRNEFLFDNEKFFNINIGEAIKLYLLKIKSEGFAHQISYDYTPAGQKKAVGSFRQTNFIFYREKEKLIEYLRNRLEEEKRIIQYIFHAEPDFKKD